MCHTSSGTSSATTASNSPQYNTHLQALSIMIDNSCQRRLNSPARRARKSWGDESTAASVPASAAAATKQTCSTQPTTLVLDTGAFLHAACSHHAVAVVLSFCGGQTVLSEPLTAGAILNWLPTTCQRRMQPVAYHILSKHHKCLLHAPLHCAETLICGCQYVVQMHPQLLLCGRTQQQCVTSFVL